jgi:hypothetical protein
MRLNPSLPLAVLLLTFPLAAAHAMDWAPDTTRILGDPAFLPYAGQVEGSFSYTYTANLYDFSSGSAGPFKNPQESWDHSNNNFLPELHYGITDDISVFANFGWGNRRASDSYIYDRLVITPVTPPVLPPGYGQYDPGLPYFPGARLVPTKVVTNQRALGAENPVFGATWRAIDQRTAPISLDVSASYSPDIFQARDSGVYQTGSIASGGQRGTLSASINHETRFFTAGAYATFGYNGRHDTAQLGYREVARSGAHPDYEIGLQTEARLLPWLALNSGISARKSVQFDNQYISPFGTTAETYKPGGTISPYAALLFALLDHRMVGELLYQHDIIGDETTSTAYGFTSRYSNQEANLFVARLRFVFGTR